MSHQFDEFSKSLAAENVSRRDSFRLLGAALAGSVLAPSGLRNASAAQRDPCKAFCKCRNRQQQDGCLAACRACNGVTSRLCGACGSYACCAEPGPFETGACISGRCEYWCVSGAVVCDEGCTLLDRDPDNCGACGNVCPDASPACINGTCSECFPGQTNCGGYCADLLWDSYNCGACGFACPGTPCVEGVCDFGSPPAE